MLVAIVRAETIQRYATLFAEAGIKIAGFTCSAAVTYSALRLFGDTPPAEILAYEAGESGVEIYGESPAKPVFSAAFNHQIAGGPELERAAAQASAELRFESAPALRPLHEMLGADPALPYAAALASACPRLCLPLNLLPVEQRQTSSPMVWVPSTVLAALVLLAAGATTALPGFENRRYLGEINAEIAKVQPAAARAAAIDREIDLTRKRTLLLDAFRARSKADMDVLAEMTRLLAPPAWLTSLELNGQQVSVAGETDQAAILLKAIDASPQFESSEFVSPPVRSRDGRDVPHPDHARGRPPGEAAMRRCHENIGAARKESPDGAGRGPGARRRGAGLRVLARRQRGRGGRLPRNRCRRWNSAWRGCAKSPRRFPENRKFSRKSRATWRPARKG